MTKKTFYNVFLVACTLLFFSGCQVVMDYHLDECDETIIDSSDTGNNAVSKHDVTNTDNLYAQPSYDPNNYIVCGNKQFRGVGYLADPNSTFYYARYYLQAPDHDDISPMPDTGEMTVSGWFQTTESIGTILVKTNAAYNSKEYRVFVEGGDLKFAMWDLYGSEYITTIQTSVNDGSWHHFAVTLDYIGFGGSSVQFSGYFDGDKEATRTFGYNGYPNDTSGDFYIGAMYRSGGLSEYFDGYIDEISMTDEEASASEVQDLYDNQVVHKNGDGSSRSCTPCGNTPTVNTLTEYRMDECEWTGVNDDVNDSSGNNHHASSKSLAQVDASGQICRSGNFDGINAYLQDADAESYLNGLSEVSVSVWVKSLQKNVDGGIFSGVEKSNNDDDFGLRYDEKGARTGAGSVKLIKASLRTSLGSTQIETQKNIQTKDWQHLVYTWKSGEELQVYADGILLNNTYSSGSIGGTISGIEYLRVGAGNKGTNWDGLIDEFKVFDKQLSLDQIQAIYNNESNGFNYDGSSRTCGICNVFTPKDGNYTAVDIVNAGCSAPTHWDNMLQTKIVNDDIELSILALDKATNLALEANITKVSVVHYPSGNNNACSGSVIDSVEVCNNCGLTDTNGCLSLNIDKSLNQRASVCVEVLIEGKDKDDTLGVSLSDSNSSDNLSIRPNTYNCDGILPSTLISEHNYSSTFKAMPLNLTSPSLGYTTNNITLSANKYMRTGDLNISLNGSLSSNGLSFVEGNASTILSFNDVGDIGIDLNDSVWANVDSDDTAEIDRVIHTECRRLFRADHFEVVLDRPFLEDNASTSFTYLSNLSPSLKMSAWMKGLNITITAKGEGNATMLNYKAPNTRFYANEVSLSPFVSLPNKHSAATKFPDVMDQNGSDIAGFIFVDGVASYSYENLGFNYDRAFSSPIIPFGVDGNESLFSLSVEDKLYTSVSGSENTDSDNNVSFFYGRLHPSDLITTLLPSNANIVYEVYDNTNSTYTAGMKQSSLFWYINNLHNDQNEGNVTLATPSSDTLINNALSGFTFSYNTVSLGRENLGIDIASTSRAFIHLNTQQWLWYVPSGFGSAYDDSAGSDCTMHPCFQFTLSANNTALKVQSGDFNGTVIPDVNRSDYIKTGVKLFR